MSALAALDQYRQFLIVKFIPLPNGKTDKIPCSLTAVGVDAHDPRNWTDRATAERAAAAWGPDYGIGFVLTPLDPFVCLDIDAARLPDGNWDGRVHEALRRLPTVACEVSRSGTGIHLWMTLASPLSPDRVIKNTALGMELYDRGRFIALGLPGASGSIRECPQVVEYAREFFPPKAPVAPGAGANDGPREGWHGPEDDDELIARGRRMKADIGHAMGGKAHFSDLWDGNVEVLARAYPATGGGASPYDGSSVDFALVNALAYLTGCDGPRMERLLRRWVLWRDKLDRDDYREMTFQGACPPGRAILQDKPSLAEVLAVEVPLPPGGAVLAPQAIEASPFATAADQIKLFEGCVYVLDHHQILMPNGSLLNEPRFNAWFGQHCFVMTADNGKTTRKAWEAFLMSGLVAWPRVDSLYFSPREPFGKVREHDGSRAVNAYRAPRVILKPGSIQPFLDHVARVIPQARDREILLSYFKAAVQRKGWKFPWGIVVQGVEGNGKSLMTKCLEYAVGERDCAAPRATDVAGRFNAWMEGTVLWVVEDLHKQRDGSDLIEAIKPMVTRRRYEIERKGVDSGMVEVFGNFLIETNHKGALRKTRNDRRFAHFHCAQQSYEDLVRDGMDESTDYFPRLLDWLEQEDGYAKVALWLHTDPISPEFDPTGNCLRAPTTSATEAAIEAGRDPVAQAVLDAVDEARTGFAGGWISSVHLSELLERKRLSHLCPPPKRGEMLKGLGYMAHQALPDGGKACKAVPGPDGSLCRPRIYVKAFSEAASIALPPDVMAAYSKAQTDI